MATSQPASEPAPANPRYAQLALISLLGGAVGIAFAPIFVRLSQVGPSATAFWRLTLALPALWLGAALQRGDAAPTARPASGRDYRLLLAAGVFFAGDLGFWHWSIRFTSVANATLLVNFMPIFVTLGSWLFFNQRVGVKFILSMLVALAGTVLIVGVSFRLSLQHLTGDGLGLVAAVFYAGYILVVKVLRRDFSTPTVMAWSSLVACLVLLPVTVAMGEKLTPVDIWGWLVLLGLALVSHIGGQGLIAFALAHLPASFSSVTLLVQPVMAAVFAWLILAEGLEPLQVAGGVLVLAGIFFARRESF